MRLLKYALVVALFPVLWAQSPQIPVTGTLGAGGVFPLVNSPSVVFAADADHTMTYPEMSGSSGFLRVTSSVSLTATRNLIAPMIVGFNWAIENATTGGHSIQVIGATGTGVTIPSGSTMPVYFDSINYVTTPAASGGTVLSVGATAPLASTGGTNPVLSLAQATAIVDGWLSHVDWATFNGKQNALGYVPAHSGANSDITSLTGLTTPLSTGQGGSGTAGGTGYRYGNGASPDSYSPTIPCSSITGGGDCLGVGTLTAYSVTLTAASTGGSATATCVYSCTSIGGYVALSSTVNCTACSVTITPSMAWPANAFCRASVVPVSEAATSYNFTDSRSSTTFSVGFASPITSAYIEYTCQLNGPVYVP